MSDGPTRARDARVDSARVDSARVDSARPGSRHLVRHVVQGVAFVAGLALLVWCVSLALKPENREALTTLSRAPWWQSGGVIALSVVSLLLNGALFWVTIRPVKRLKLVDVQATNGVATLLNYLPFKIGLAARFVIHHRRDHVPLLTIAAWLAAGAVAALAVFVPLTAASAWRRAIDPLWCLAGLGGVVACAAVLWGISRAFAHARGMSRLHGLARVTGLGRFGLSWVLRSRAFGHLHHGFAMLAGARTVGAVIAMRLADVAVSAARFKVAGIAVGVPIGWDTAVLAACAHFVLGVVVPSGQLGMREGGMTGLAALLVIPGVTTGEFAVAALVVGGAELAANLVVGGLGFARIKPWRLVGSGRAGAGEEGPVAASASEQETPSRIG